MSSSEFHCTCGAVNICGSNVADCGSSAQGTMLICRFLNVLALCFQFLQAQLEILDKTCEVKNTLSTQVKRSLNTSLSVSSIAIFSPPQIILRYRSKSNMKCGRNHHALYPNEGSQCLFKSINVGVLRLQPEKFQCSAAMKFWCRTTIARRPTGTRCHGPNPQRRMPWQGGD